MAVLQYVGAFVVASGVVGAQRAPARPIPPMERPSGTTANPIVESVRSSYETMKGYVVAAAAEMPAADYAFRPATLPAADQQTIRTFGQVVGHIAQENYLLCASAAAQPAPADTDQILATKTTKPDLEQALADSFRYCDQVWAGTTDKNASDAGRYPASLPLPQTTRLGALVLNTSHDAEHYGNLVTYLRAKGLVPPSSQRAK